MENVSEIDVQSLVRAMKTAQDALEPLEAGPLEIMRGEVSPADLEALLSEALELNAIVAGCLTCLQEGRENRQKCAKVAAPAVI